MGVALIVFPLIAGGAFLLGYFVGFSMGSADAQVQELDRTLTRLEEKVRDHD